MNYLLKKISLYSFYILLPCVKSAWICDDKLGFSINGSEVAHSGAPGDDRTHNCLWMENNGVLSGSHYWRIHFEKLHSVGGVCLTSLECFKKGYGTKGLCYHGNLSDNSKLLVRNFGPEPSEGDAVGVLASFEGDRLKVYIDVNGKMLGLAFDVPISLFNPLFIVVRFYKYGSATILKDAIAPDMMNQYRTTFTGIEGDWKLTNIKYNTIITSSLKFSELTTHIRKAIAEIDEEDVYRWYIRGISEPFIMRCLRKDGNKWRSFSHLSFMIEDPTFKDLENKISDLMAMVRTVYIETDGSLSIKSDNISTVWTRYNSTPTPFVLNNTSSHLGRCQVGPTSVIFNL